MLFIPLEQPKNLVALLPKAFLAQSCPILVLKSLVVIFTLLAVVQAQNTSNQINKSDVYGLGSISGMVYGPDSAFVSYGGRGIVLWDTRDYKPSRVLESKEYIKLVSFSPDGQKLMAETPSGITLWDLRSGSQSTIFQKDLQNPWNRHTDILLDVNFQSDTLALRGDDNTTIELWSIKDKKLKTTLQSNSKYVLMATFNNDGLTSVSVSEDDVFTVRLWDIAKGEFEARLLEPSATMDLSPDGLTLAYGSTDSTIKILDIPTGELKTKLKISGELVHKVAFSPDGKMLFSEERNKHIFEAEDGKAIRILKQDENVTIWDVSTGQPISVLSPEIGMLTDSVSFSPDGNTLATIESFFASSIRLWDVKTGKLKRSLEGHISGAGNGNVTLSPDGKKLFSGSTFSTINIWDVKSKEIAYTLQTDQGTTRAVAINSDGSKLATGSSDGTIKLWDFKTKKLLQTFEGRTGAIYQVAFSPDGNLLASASEDKAIKLWNIKTEKLQTTLIGHTDYEVCCVAFNPTGQMLASGGLGVLDNTVRLWNVDSGEPEAILEGHSSYVVSVVFSPDGKMLASASLDESIKLWDLETLEVIRTIPTGKEISTIIFFPDSLTLASGGGITSDGTIKLWDVESGKLKGALRGHNSSVISLDLSQDGNLLASSSWDGTLRLWDVEQWNSTP